jgi:hypothetical protein
MVALGLLDTNILIDRFNGIPQASAEISYYDDLGISSVTWMELMTRFFTMTKLGTLPTAEFQQIHQLNCGLRDWSTGTDSGTTYADAFLFAAVSGAGGWKPRCTTTGTDSPATVTFAGKWAVTSSGIINNKTGVVEVPSLPTPRLYGPLKLPSKARCKAGWSTSATNCFSSTTASILQCRVFSIATVKVLETRLSLIARPVSR